MSRTYLWDNEILSKVNIISRVNGKLKNKGYSLHDAYVEVAEELNKKLNNAESPLRITYNQVLNRYVYLKKKMTKNIEVIISKQQEERLNAKMAEDEEKDYKSLDDELTAKEIKAVNKEKLMKITDNNYQQVLDKRIQIINKLPNLTLWQLVDKKKLIKQVNILIDRLTINGSKPGIYDVAQVMANLFYNSKEHTPSPQAIYQQYKFWGERSFTLEEKEPSIEVTYTSQEYNELAEALNKANGKIVDLTEKNNILVREGIENKKLISQLRDNISVQATEIINLKAKKKSIWQRIFNK